MLLHPLIAGISMLAATAQSTRLVGSGHLALNSTLKVRQQPDTGAAHAAARLPDQQQAQQAGHQPAQQMSAIVGALLMVNGKQTLCETTMMAPQMGLVAASCLIYQDNKLDDTITYTVGLSNGPNAVYGNPNANQVVPHPNYNPETFENNLAVVLTTSSMDFANSIADWQVDWAYYYFVHRSQTEGPECLWNDPMITRTDGTNSVALNQDQCSAASSVHAANLDDFIRSPHSITYYYNRSCNIPYGAVYIGHVDAIAPAAIYSHSTIYGHGGYCGDGKIIHYYTVLRNYLKWAESVSGITASVYHSDNPPGYTTSNNAAFRMNPPGHANDPAVHIYGQFFINNTNTLQPGSELFGKETGNVRSALYPSLIFVETVQVTETSTDPITENLTELAREATTRVATEYLASTGVVTSTLVETASTIETYTTTVLATNSVGATELTTAIFTSDLSNPIASLIITPSFYTYTVTAHDTITETVTQGHNENITRVDKLQRHNASTVTESVNITTTLGQHSSAPAKHTVGANANIVVFTEMVVSTISGNNRDVTRTVIEATTVTPHAAVFTSVVTVTDIHVYSTTTMSVITSNSSFRTNRHEPNMPANNQSPDSGSNKQPENSSNTQVTGIIVAIVLLMLLLVGLLYYWLVNKKGKAKEVIRSSSKE